MNDVDKRAIEKLAAAQNYHGPERGEAQSAYYRGLENGELDQGPHMLFMSEVCNVCPDLMLRAKYRAEVKALYETKFARDYDAFQARNYNSSL